MSDTLLQFVHISDTHLLAPGQIKDFGDIEPELAFYAEQVLAVPYHTVTAAEAMIAAINNLPLKLDFVLHTGDVIGDDDVDYDVIGQMLEKIKYPVIYTPGNHDDAAGVGRLAGRVMESVDEYEFNGVQMVCLDSSRYGEGAAGWLDDTQLNRLRAICEATDNRPLLIALHHHTQPIGVDWLDHLRLRNGEALHNILLKARHRLRGVFNGHIHHSVDVVKDGILYSTAASAAYQFIGWPGHQQTSLDMTADPSFNVVTITPDQTFVRHHHYRISY